LILLDVIPISIKAPGSIGMQRRGLIAAFFLGLVFGIALGPCTFAFMAPVLAVVFKVSATALLYGISLLVVYGLGHCSVIIFAGTFTEAVQHYMNWNEKSSAAIILKRICGALVLVAGLYLLFKA
jgi:cytochrome c-type biogenesis protein